MTTPSELEANLIITIALSVITVFLGYVVLKIKDVDEIKILVARLEGKVDSIDRILLSLPKRKADVSD